MSYFDDASLVMIPSGYKDQKVYSVKPLDGSGDLTFSRASSATRVNSSGLVEKVRENLLTYSNDFSNAAWTKIVATLTSGQIGYDGTNNAWLYTEGTFTSSLPDINQPHTTSTTIATYSFYAKAGTKNWVILSVGATGYTFVNLSDGSVGGSYGSLPLSITTESVGSGWYRIKGVSAASAISMSIHITTGDGVTSYNGDGTGTIYIQNAQRETGDIATDYIATTSSAVSVGPVSGLPRLDYSGGASCPSLLLEPQRTNIHTYSEQIASWSSFSGATITSNAAVSPDGYSSADKINETSTTEFFIAGNNNTISGSTTYTISFFAKAAERTIARMLLGVNALGQHYAYFNLSTGAITSDLATAKMEDYGNGWWRCSVTATSLSSPTGIVAWIGPSNNMTNAYNTYAGTAGNGIYAYGMQVESGAYETSLIPTLSTAVTRVRETVQKTSISSLIGQTEGVLFAEFSFNGAANSGIYEVIISVNDGTSNNRIDLVKNNTTSELYVYAINGGVIQVNSVGIAGTDISGSHKVALAYKLNDYVCYLDGVQVYSDTSATVPTVGILDIGTDSTNTITGTISQALLFKTRLSNSDLATLTSL